MDTAPVFAGTDEAMDMARAALRYLAATHATQLGAAGQARCLKAFEQPDAIGLAARASFQAAFTAGRATPTTRPSVPGVADPPDPHHQRRGGGAYRVGQADPNAPAVLAALAAGEPAALFAEMYQRAQSDLPDEDPDRDFEDRGLKLAVTFGSAGVLHGDLTRSARKWSGGCWTRWAPRSGRGERAASRLHAATCHDQRGAEAVYTFEAPRPCRPLSSAGHHGHESLT